MMDFGEGPVGSNFQIVELYRKSAEQGHDGAQYNLGMIYYDGERGVYQSARTAAKWFEKAAMQGHLDAQFMAARINTILYFVKAWAWMRIVEERGHPDAQKLRDYIEPRILDFRRKQGEDLYRRLRTEIPPAK